MIVSFLANMFDKFAKRDAMIAARAETSGNPNSKDVFTRAEEDAKITFKGEDEKENGEHSMPGERKEDTLLENSYPGICILSSIDCIPFAGYLIIQAAQLRHFFLSGDPAKQPKLVDKDEVESTPLTKQQVINK